MSSDVFLKVISMYRRYLEKNITHLDDASLPSKNGCFTFEAKEV